MEQEALRPRRGLRAGGRWEGEAAARTYCERKKRSRWRAFGIEEAVAGTLTQGSCVCRDGRGRACVGAGWSRDVKKVRVQGTWGQAPGETLREQEGPRLPLQPREGKRQEQASPAPKEEGEARVPGAGGEEPGAFVDRELVGVGLRLKKERAKGLCLWGRDACVWPAGVEGTPGPCAWGFLLQGSTGQELRSQRFGAVQGAS